MKTFPTFRASTSKCREIGKAGRRLSLRLGLALKWICSQVQTHFVEKELTQCVQHFVVHSKSKWSVCDASACHGNMGDELQVLCVTCRKWFHTNCLPGKVIGKYSDTYFKCTSIAKK